MYFPLLYEVHVYLRTSVCMRTFTDRIVAMTNNNKTIQNSYDQFASVVKNISFGFTFTTWFVSTVDSANFFPPELYEKITGVWRWDSNPLCKGHEFESHPKKVFKARNISQASESTQFVQQMCFPFIIFLQLRWLIEPKFSQICYFMHYVRIDKWEYLSLST